MCSLLPLPPSLACDINHFFAKKKKKFSLCFKKMLQQSRVNLLPKKFGQTDPQVLMSYFYSIYSLFPKA